MKPTSRIRIEPAEELQPRPAAIPLAFAQRWDSPFDRDGIKTTVKVFVTQPAYARMCVHASSEMEQETGGILVGQWCTDVDTDEQFIVVENALPARYTRQGSVYLTFTQDTLVDIHAKIEERYPSRQIVGWYHTHPKMGIFLSHYDTWLHSYFFPEPWQVALVIEPHKKLGGFFVRQPGGQLDPARYFGFHELESNLNWSIVHWKNLHRVVDFGSQEGD